MHYFEPSKLLEACAAKEGTKVFPGQTLIDVVLKDLRVIPTEPRAGIDPVRKGHSQPEAAAGLRLCVSLHGSGSTMLIPSFDRHSRGERILPLAKMTSFVCLGFFVLRKMFPSFVLRESITTWDVSLALKGIYHMGFVLWAN